MKRNAGTLLDLSSHSNVGFEEKRVEYI